jgi:hypothetical protein
MKTKYCIIETHENELLDSILTKNSILPNKIIRSLILSVLISHSWKNNTIKQIAANTNK